MATKKIDTQNNSYDFLISLCAARKVKVIGKIEKAVSGTFKIFNAYKKPSMKFDNCKGKHYEVFQDLRKKKSISFEGLTCTFEQGENISDRILVFDKMPKGLELKK